MSRWDAIVVGAGVAGLECARELTRAGKHVLVLEASNRVGGRVGSDYKDGFILDRGFQIYLTQYPTASKVLDYPALHFRKFYSGALVRRGTDFHRIADPFNHPIDSLSQITSPLFSFRDGFVLGKLYLDIMRMSGKELWTSENISTIDYLRSLGLSGSMIEHFMKPFFGGVFFDQDLETSARMFRFTFRMFATGPAVIPARGMQAIAEQLRGMLPDDAVKLEHPVERIDGNDVHCSDGRSFSADQVIIATDPDTADRLTDRKAKEEQSWRSTMTFYYSAPKAPSSEPILYLNGNDGGPINHLCISSNVSEHYAPEGRALISANTTRLLEEDDEALDVEVRKQMKDWFGAQVEDWVLLKVYRIPKALPVQSPEFFAKHQPCEERGGAIVCGDFHENGSINGAVRSGIKAAERVLSK